MTLETSLAYPHLTKFIEVLPDHPGLICKPHHRAYKRTQEIQERG
jgi:hypothetical protein